MPEGLHVSEEASAAQLTIEEEPAAFRWSPTRDTHEQSGARKWKIENMGWNGLEHQRRSCVSLRLCVSPVLMCLLMGQLLLPPLPRVR